MHKIAEPKTLLAEKHVDLNREYRLRHVKSETEYFRPHNHDYYEIFLVLGGNAQHWVNGDSVTVSKGILIFIRDFDTHDYHAQTKDFEFLNLAFTKTAFNDMANYLGDGFDAEGLLSVPYPPFVRLSSHDMQKLRLSLAELHSFDETDAILKARMRRKLADIFCDYFAAAPVKTETIPFWLENAYEQMRKPKNFVKGKERFFELTGRTREHSTRYLNKFYGTTPSELINDLRLRYAESLLRSSNLSVTDICFECGFHNVSWFYNTFEKKHGISPVS